MSDHSKQTHPYHLVNPSPWPALGAFSLLALTIGSALTMHKYAAGHFVLLAGLAGVLYTMFGWWRDVIKEGIVDHAHTGAVSRGLRLGMALFIISEILFFVAFFWAFFNASTLPKLPIDDVWGMGLGTWPPKNIQTFDPWHLPFLNTLILLLSGTTVTWAHAAILKGNNREAVQALWYTVILGVTFTALQAFEYGHAAFGLKDGIYPTTFYLATGFHGFHVIVGTIFLSICLIRAGKNQFTPKHHLGFEFAAWYWHFVDVVWLFLFIFVYFSFANKLMPAFEAIFTVTNLAIFGVLSLIIAGVGGWYALKNGKLKLPAPHH